MFDSSRKLLRPKWQEHTGTTRGRSPGLFSTFSLRQPNAGQENDGAFAQNSLNQSRARKQRAEATSPAPRPKGKARLKPSACAEPFRTVRSKNQRNASDVTPFPLRH